MITWKYVIREEIKKERKEQPQWDSKSPRNLFKTVAVFIKAEGDDLSGY